MTEATEHVYTDGPRDYHFKWSKSDREKQTWYCLYVKKYKWTYLQNRNRLTDLENELMVTREEGWG